MSNNNFKVKKKKEDIITVEEVKDSKFPFIIFFRKHGGIVYLTLMILAFTLFIIGLGLTISSISNISNFRTTSTGTSISFFDNKEDILLNKATPVTEKYAVKYFNKKISNLSKNKGVIIETNVIDITTGKIIYFSDYTSMILYNNNSFKRIGSVNNGYGIDEQGNIAAGAKIEEGTITKTTNVNDTSKLLYLSNDSIVLEKEGYYILFRDGANLSINGNLLTNDYLVAVIDKVVDIGTSKLTYYTDGTIKLIKDNNTYIIRDLNDVTINNDNITLNTNNIPMVLNNINLNTMTIIYYTDGTAEIVSKNNSILVRKSKYIVMDEAVYEITINNDNNINQIYKNTIGDNNVYYFSDGSGVIEYYDGTYKYIDDNNNINGTLSNVNGLINKNIHNTSDGSTVITFNDEISFVKKNDNKGYIIDQVIYDSNNNILKQDTELSNFYDLISFNLTNNSENKIIYRIVLEETDTSNYQELYSINRLNPAYMKYIIQVGNKTINPSFVNNTWSLGYSLAGGLTIKNNTYILYEGTLEGYSGTDVSFMLWLDYETITNEMMSRGFIGTIKVYSEEQN